jgi:hypothetical protein
VINRAQTIKFTLAVYFQHILELPLRQSGRRILRDPPLASVRYRPETAPRVRSGRARRCRWKDDSAFAKIAYVADQALHDLLDDMERLAKQRKPAISP